MTTGSSPTGSASICTHILELQGHPFLKSEDDVHPSEYSRHPCLPEEILLEIFNHVRTAGPKSWLSLMQVSRQFSRIALRLQYHTLNDSQVHDVHERSANPLGAEVWPDFSNPHPYQGIPLKSTLRHGSKDMIQHMQVFHSYCDGCTDCTSGSRQSTLFPNLRVFHTHALQPRAGFTLRAHTLMGSSSCPPRSFRCIPTFEEAPRLHTVVIHTNDAVREWREFCQSEAAIRKTNRMIINWWEGSHHSTTSALQPVPLRSGAGVRRPSCSAAATKKQGGIAHYCQLIPHWF